MPALQVPPGVEGFLSLVELPDDAWRSRWDRIVAPDGLKERLLNFVLFSLRHRARLDPVGLPVHGLVVLSGPPGTGKTTLAGGLADRAAREFGGSGLLFVDTETTGLAGGTAGGALVGGTSACATTGGVESVAAGAGAASFSGVLPAGALFCATLAKQ